MSSQFDFADRNEEDDIDPSWYLDRDIPMFDGPAIETDAAPEISSDQYQEDDLDPSGYLDEDSKWKFPEPIRHSVRTVSRIAETIAGLPGDIVQTSKMILDSLPELPRLLKRDPNFIQRKGQDILNSIPTSQDLKEFSSYVTATFTDPQSAEEEFGDDIVSLGTAIMTPTKNPLQLRKIFNALGLALGAKSVAKGVELYGGGEQAQNATEMGSLVLTSMLTRRFADSFIKSKYQHARSLIPEGTMINTGSMISNLNSVEKELRKGLPSTSSTKTQVLNSIDELKSKVAGGATEFDDILQSYHDINEKLTSRKLFDELSKPEQKLLKTRYDKLKSVIGDEIANYGQFNPEFYKEWQEANSGFATLAKTKRAKDFIVSNMKTLPGHIAASAAIKLFLGLPALTAAGGGFAAYQTGMILSRIAGNPTLRKYYTAVMKSAVEENVGQIVHNLSKLDRELKKDEEVNLREELESFE